jgi:hypothetical protein
MTTDIWNNNGNWFSNANLWSLDDTPPTSSEDALIASGGVTLTGAGVADVIVVNAYSGLNVASGGTLTAAGLVSNGNGQINVATGNNDGGESVTISGMFANEVNASFILGNSNLSASTTVTVGQLANSGVITLWGNENLGTTNQATFDVKSAAPSELTGSLYLHGDADVEFASGAITAIASGVEFQIDGRQSRISIGAGTTDSALTTLSTNLGTFDLEGSTGQGGASINTTVGLFNGGALDIDTYNADGASEMTIGGTLTNTGSVVLGNSNLAAPSSLTVSGLNNLGTINLLGDEKIGTTEQATFDDTSAAPTTLTGKIYIHGDSLFEFASGGIASVGVGAELQIDGAQARYSIGAGTTNSALNNLSSNYGVFDEEGDLSTGPGGAVVATSVAFTNYDDFYLDLYGGDGASSFTATGVFTNDDLVQIGNGGLSANTTLTVGSLVNNGEVLVYSQATAGAGEPQAAVDVGSAAPSAEAGFLRLIGDSVIDFASGAINSIAYGGEIEFDGGAASIESGAKGSNSGLATLSNNAGTLLLRGDNGFGSGVVLNTTTGLKNSGALQIDYYGGDGGSAYSLTGALNNSGTVYIGNTSLVANTTVSAASFANTGNLALQGNVASGATTQAKLAISGAAAATVTNSIRIGGDANLSFGAGTGLIYIAYGGELELDGSQANISANGGGQNSGVAHLVNNSGTLLLRGDSGYGAAGVTLTTSAGFTNAGTLQIDYYGGDGGSNVTFNGTLINAASSLISNSGAIDIGNGSLSATTTVKTTFLSNEGDLTIQGNTTANAARATLAVSGASQGVVTNIIRVGGDATLSFGVGTGFTSVALGGSLELDSAQASVAAAGGGQNSGIAALVTNAGTLLLRGNSGFGSGGVTWTSSHNFTNTGTTEIDYYGYDGGSTVQIAAALINSGTLDIGNGALSAATLVQAATLTLANSGSLLIEGNTTAGGASATLAITGASTYNVTNSIRLAGDATLSFGTGNGITTVSAGGDLEIDSAQASVVLGAGGQNSGLTKLSSNAGTVLLRGDEYGSGGVTLTTTTALTNTGDFYVDYYGYDSGSSVTIGGGLINEGTFTLGNGNLSAASSVKATYLNNYAGQINVYGGNGFAATLTLTGSATNDASVNVGSGGDIAVSGGYTQYGGSTFINGTLSSSVYTQDGGSTTVNGTLSAATVNVRDGGASGNSFVYNSALTSSSVTKSVTLANAADVTFNAAVSSSQTVSFQDASDTLFINAPASFAGIIKGFADGDTIDLNSPVTSLTYSAGVLDVFSGATEVAALSFSGAYSQSNFSFVTEQYGRTQILDSVAAHS